MTPNLDDLIAAIDGQRMMGKVAALAGDRFTGRRTGTPGGAAARDWLADRSWWPAPGSPRQRPTILIELHSQLKAHPRPDRSRRS